MSDMPDYTLKEKADAFDRMWEHLGPGIPRFSRYVVRYSKDRILADIDSFGGIGSAVQYERVPVYEFTINFTGNCYSFKDVLHAIVLESRETRKGRK